MKNLKDFTVPLYFELDCKSSKEVDGVTQNVLEIAQSYGLGDKINMELIQPHPYYSKTAVVSFSLNVTPSKNETNILQFFEELFESYYQNYPRFAEPTI